MVAEIDFEREALVKCAQQTAFGTILPRDARSAADNEYDGYVMCGYPLGPGWSGRKLPFHTDFSARMFLYDHGFGRDNACYLPTAHYWANELAGSIAIDRLDSTASRLRSGDLWCVPIFPRPFVNPGYGMDAHGKLVLTADTVCQKLNADLATNIDFAFTSKMEGGQWRRGYIPFNNGKVMGKSGVTIGSGFDLGQQSADKLKKANFSQFFMDLFTPYLGLPLTGLTREQLETLILQRGPMPILIHKADADELDRLSFTIYANAAQSVWAAAKSARERELRVLREAKKDAHSLPELKSFADLSRPWQTAIFDFVLSRGTGGFEKSDFGRSALAGDAVAAKKALQLDTHDRHRRHAEWETLSGDHSTLTLPLPPPPPPHKPETPHRSETPVPGRIP